MISLELEMTGESYLPFKSAFTCILLNTTSPLFHLHGPGNSLLLTLLFVSYFLNLRVVSLSLFVSNSDI